MWDPAQYAADPATKVEYKRFKFPRQPGGEFLCISDYYAPMDSGQVDVVQLQAVTVGAAADAEFERLQSADNYSEAYFFHGLAVQMAEAVANYISEHVRRELGIPANRGKRYSWGYPACPDLEDHTLVWELLPQTADIGLELTPSYQITPEQSTAGDLRPPSRCQVLQRQ